MKFFIPAALVSLALLTSCSSMYRSGRTPDDVYFSPGQPVAASSQKDEYAYTDPDDNYLRMKVQDRTRWNAIDDANYWYSYNQPYSNLYYYNPTGLSVGWNNYGWNSWNSYAYPSYFGGYPFWNTYNYGYYPGYYSYPGYTHGYYGGYYPGTVVIRNLRSNTGPKPYMGGYTNNSFNNTNNSNRNSSGLGRFIRSSTGTNNNNNSYNNSNEYNRPTRTFTPSPSSSSGSSSSGSSRSTGSSSGGGRTGRGGR